MPVEVKISDAPDEVNIIIEAGATASAVVTGSGSSTMANLGFGNAVINNGMASQNAVANQRAISQVGLMAVGKAVQMVSTLTPLQARASQDVLTDNPLASSIAAEKSVTPAPPHVYGRTIYVEMPVYLLYRNTDGIDNIAAIVLNHVPDPLPSGTIYANA